MKRMMLLLLVLTTTGCIELPIRPDPDAKFMKEPKTAAAKAPTNQTPAPAMERAARDAGTGERRQRSADAERAARGDGPRR